MKQTPRTDWAQLRERLAAMGSTDEAPAERTAEILRRRAERLSARAAPLMQEATSVLVFRAGEHRCAIAAASLVEVRALPPRARVPGWPESLVGVVNVRGEIHPIVDLAALLKSSDANAELLIVARAALREVGIVASKIEGFQRVGAEAWARPGDGLASVVRGVNSEGVWLVDAEELSARVLAQGEGM